MAGPRKVVAGHVSASGALQPVMFFHKSIGDKREQTYRPQSNSFAPINSNLVAGNVGIIFAVSPSRACFA